MVPQQNARPAADPSAADAAAVRKQSRAIACRQCAEQITATVWRRVDSAA
jgi:hypothetical protein